MKKLYSLFILMLGGYIAQAQSIGPSTLNASGGSATISNNVYDYSIGEMTVVSTATTNNNVFTQGVLQPHTLKAEAIDNVTLANNLFQVFPNPTSGILYIQSKDNAASIDAVRLLDMNGKIIVQKEINSAKTEIDLSAYANGNYTLQVNTGDKTVKVLYKITKLN